MLALILGLTTFCGSCIIQRPCLKYLANFTYAKDMYNLCAIDNTLMLNTELRNTLAWLIISCLNSHFAWMHNVQSTCWQKTICHIIGVNYMMVFNTIHSGLSAACWHIYDTYCMFSAKIFSHIVPVHKKHNQTRIN